MRAKRDKNTLKVASQIDLDVSYIPETRIVNLLNYNKILTQDQEQSTFTVVTFNKQADELAYRVKHSGVGCIRYTGSVLKSFSN